MTSIGLFVVYMWLRAECVIPWDSTDWVRQNPDLHLEFADTEHGFIYVPITFPAEDKAYIQQIEEQNPEHPDGLQWIIMSEPDRLFDWLASRWRMRLWVTSTLVLIVHLMIITCVASAAAYVGARLGTAPSENADQGS